jgi:hypothetical protein
MLTNDEWWVNRGDPMFLGIMNPIQHRIGIDIGRVIIEGDGPDTNFVGGTEEEALRAPAIDGAFDAIARLVARVGPAHVHLVSKCGKRVEGRTRTWLAHHRFFERTGVLPDNVHFCRAREQKAPICRDLGVTCFVDDRIDVLAFMTAVVPHRFLFGASDTDRPGVVPVPTWTAAEEAIASALG